MPRVPRVPIMLHISFETPLHPSSMLFAITWGSCLAQALVLLLFQSAAAMSRGEVLISFCNVDHSRISIIFFRNWLGLNNLCEILQVPECLSAWVSKYRSSTRVLMCPSSTRLLMCPSSTRLPMCPSSTRVSQVPKSISA